MKSSDTSWWQGGFSRLQIIIIIAVIILCLFLLGLGWNIRKLAQLEVNVQPPGMVDILRMQATSVLNVNIKNPTLIPFSILPCSLTVRNSENRLIAHFDSEVTTRVRGMSTTAVPLYITFEPDATTQDKLSLLTQKVSIEGSVTARAFGYQRRENIRKTYAMSELFKNSR